MAYTTPTAADIKERFPEFSSVSNNLIDLIIAEAVGVVNTSWVEADYRPAIMYWVAHTLVSQGHGVAGGGASVVLTGPMKSRQVGDVKVEFAGVGGSGGAGNGSSSLYDTTAYGRRFLDYLRANFSAIAVV